MSLSPIYLFADSQLLFWQCKGAPFLQSIREHLNAPAPRAAYIGASNADAPEAYAIFVEAMRGIGIEDFQMIHSSFGEEDRSFLKAAQLIVLAGGDVELGWKTFTRTGMKEEILERYAQGAVVIGVSAGAMQLGLHALVEKSDVSVELIDAFQCVPFLIGVHDEQRNWQQLRRTIELLEGRVYGIGIPTGGGLIYHPDQTLEAIRHPLEEFVLRDGQIRHALISQLEPYKGSPT
jgi:cyanophycinase